MSGNRRERGNAGRASTAWSGVAEWYDQLVGEEGSDFHREVVFPNALRMLALGSDDHVLDVACGQGAFCRVLHARGISVVGVDASRELIAMARQHNAKLDPARGPHPEYQVADARDLSRIRESEFSAVACILAIQNIDKLPPTFAGIVRVLKPGGRLVMVMMHPCFRSPKHSGWGWDEKQGVQYRRVDRYLLPRKEPIFTHPGKKTGEYTWTFHRPLQTYVKALRGAGLLVDSLEEWASHKQSTSGPRAAAENQARSEIPMFLAIRAIKSPTVPSIPASGHAR